MLPRHVLTWLFSLQSLQGSPLMCYLQLTHLREPAQAELAPLLPWAPAVPAACAPHGQAHLAETKSTSLPRDTRGTAQTLSYLTATASW